MGKRSFVWETESSVDRIRRWSDFEPLQQRNDLGVINKHLPARLQRDGNGCIGQNFNRIALFKVSLAHFGIRRHTGELPVGREIVDKRIVYRRSGSRNSASGGGSIRTSNACQGEARTGTAFCRIARSRRAQ